MDIGGIGALVECCVCFCLVLFASNLLQNHSNLFKYSSVSYVLPTVTVQGISHSSTKYSTHTNSNKTKQNSTCTSHTLSHKSHFSLDSLYQRHGKKPKGRKKNRKELFKSEKQLSIQSVDLVISYHSERDAATNKTKNYIQTPADFVLLNPVLFSSSFSFIFSKFFVLFIFSYFVRIVY